MPHGKHKETLVSAGHAHGWAERIMTAPNHVLDVSCLLDMCSESIQAVLL